jgi:hypothetical protein
MKKIFFILAIAISILSCQKTEETPKSSTPALNPVQKQWGLVIEYTAKWCGPCGNWGAPTMHDLTTSSPYVVGIAAHASGDPMFDNALYSTFSADRTTGGGIPAFWIGDTKTQSASALTTILGKTATAAIDLNYTKTATTMTVNTQTKFFTATSGDYYLSVLLMESGIDGGTSATSDYQQNGTSDPNFKHEHVLRASAVAGKSYGASIISGAITAGKTVNKTYTIAIDPSWKKTLYPCAILWKYEAGSAVPMYKFVNCIEKK